MPSARPSLVIVVVDEHCRRLLVGDAVRPEGGDGGAHLGPGQGLEVEHHLGVAALRVHALDALVAAQRRQRVHVGREAARQVHLHHSHVGGARAAALDVVRADGHLEKEEEGRRLLAE